MAMSKSPAKVKRSGSSSPESQLKSFVDKFAPANQALIRAVRKTLRNKFPTANELVYDNYNFFVIGYSPTERPSDCLFSIAAAANGVGLAFYRGATLPDPHRLLQGSGVQNRFIRLESHDTLIRPEIQTLLAAAVSQSKVPLRASGPGILIIRSISAKQRPRRKSNQKRSRA